MNVQAPVVDKVLEEDGEISDELDYAIMTYILKNRGAGYTACQPQLVQLGNGSKAIKMNIDNTFVGKNNQLMGLGIVGKIFIDHDSLKILYCTPKDELEANTKKLEEAGYEPQPRPHGKY